jgi:hypothetical protein
MNKYVHAYCFTGTDIENASYTQLVHTYMLERSSCIHTKQQNKALEEGGSIYAGKGSSISITGGDASEGSARRHTRAGTRSKHAAASDENQPSEAVRQAVGYAQVGAASMSTSTVSSAVQDAARVSRHSTQTSERRSEESPPTGGISVDNNAARSGGAVSLDGASLMVQGAVSFAGNAATGSSGGGGAVSAVDSDIEIDGASFDGNAAQSGTHQAHSTAYFVNSLEWRSHRI